MMGPVARAVGRAEAMPKAIQLQQQQQQLDLARQKAAADHQYRMARQFAEAKKAAYRTAEQARQQAHQQEIQEKAAQNKAYLDSVNGLKTELEPSNYEGGDVGEAMKFKNTLRGIENDALLNSGPVSALRKKQAMQRLFKQVEDSGLISRKRKPTIEEMVKKAGGTMTLGRYNDMARAMAEQNGEPFAPLSPDLDQNINTVVLTSDRAGGFRVEVDSDDKKAARELKAMLRKAEMDAKVAKQTEDYKNPKTVAPGTWRHNKTEEQITEDVKDRTTALEKSTNNKIERWVAKSSWLLDDYDPTTGKGDDTGEAVTAKTLGAANNVPGNAHRLSIEELEDRLQKIDDKKGPFSFWEKDAYEKVLQLRKWERLIDNPGLLRDAAEDDLQGNSVRREEKAKLDQASNNAQSTLNAKPGLAGLGNIPGGLQTLKALAEADRPQALDLYMNQRKGLSRDRYEFLVREGGAILERIEELEEELGDYFKRDPGESGDEGKEPHYTGGTILYKVNGQTMRVDPLVYQRLMKTGGEAAALEELNALADKVRASLPPPPPPSGPDPFISDPFGPRQKLGSPQPRLY